MPSRAFTGLISISKWASMRCSATQNASNLKLGANKFLSFQIWQPIASKPQKHQTISKLWSYYLTQKARFSPSLRARRPSCLTRCNGSPHDSTYLPHTIYKKTTIRSVQKVFLFALKKSPKAPNSNAPVMKVTLSRVFPGGLVVIAELKMTRTRANVATNGV